MNRPRTGVRELLHRLNHENQPLAFVLAKKRQYLAKDRRALGIWEALEFLNTLVDDSDGRIPHFPRSSNWLQTAEAQTCRWSLRASSS